MIFPNIEDDVRLPLKIGQSFSRTVCFDSDLIQKFAGFIGDYNPLHNNKEVAEKSTFGGIIASGTQTSSMLSAMVASKLCSLLPCVGLEISFRFLKPIYADVEILAKLELTNIQSNNRLGGDIVTFSGQLLLSDGTLLLSGTMVSLVYPEKT